MTFLLLKQLTVTDIIEKKEKIVLIVGYSTHSYLLFFKDKTFIHYDRKSAKPLGSGQLPFLPEKHLPSRLKGRIVLLGLDGNNNWVAGCIKVESNYLLQTRELSNVRPEPSAVFSLFEPPQKENKTFYLIKIQKNIENGISIEIFDFQRNIWQEHILHLGSKFLHCHIFDSCSTAQNYKEINDVHCSAFVLVAAGERYDSIHYSKIKVCHERISQTQLNLKIKFVVTRQLKLKQHFVMVGGMTLEDNKMILIGNSKAEMGNSTLFKQLTAYVIFNTHQLEIDEPQNAKVQHVFKEHVKVEESIMFRSFIGVAERNMLAVVGIENKKWGIAKINEKSTELLITFSMKKPQKLMLTSTHDSIFSYQNELEYFFQKIKTAPSKLTFRMFKIEGKQIQYHKLIKQKYPKLGEHFADLIVSLL